MNIFRRRRLLGIGGDSGDRGNKQMAGIGTLLCGSGRADGIAKVALDQLSKSIDNFSLRALGYLKTGLSDETKSLGPFCARVLLENGCAAIVGRLDSFRMMYLSEFQAQPDFEFGKRAKSGFSWTGDVIPEDRLSQGLWSSEYEIPKISRALFSKHLEHLYWKPDVEKMLDYISGLESVPALEELKQFDSETYIGRTKGRAIQLYSTLSKGVHWEFFTSANLFDEVTVKTLIRDTLLLVGHLGLTSHFIPTAYCPLSAREAVDRYLELRKEVP